MAQARWDPSAPFVERAAALPVLGVGLSTEFGATQASGTDPVALRDAHPDAIAFLEIGADLARGVDADAARWISRGWPTTWHFLDVNLEEPEDLDEAWVRDTSSAARGAGAAWVCGDAGLWHVGPRDRGHGTLLPPVGCAASADAMAGAIRHLRHSLGLEVLPENPPGHVLLGDLHPLAYFARVGAQADCGLLLDVAHLAIVQKALGCRPTFGLDTFPLERVVEIHVAGGTEFLSGRRTLIDDDHGPAIHPDTWQILDAVVPRLTALRAVVVDCERNPPEVVLALLDQVRRRVSAAPGLAGRTPVAPPSWPLPAAEPVDHRRLQRVLFRRQLHAEGGDGELAPREAAWLRAADPDLVRADPGHRRRDQLLGNVGLEFEHTLAVAPHLLAGFVGSAQLEDAVTHDRPLVFAFGAWAAEGATSPLTRALITLDVALAEARRTALEPARGFVRLTDRVRLVRLPAGTVAAATAIREGAEPDGVGESSETILIRRTPAGPHRPADVAVEVLPDGLGALLQAMPLEPHEIAAFAAAHDLSARELDDLVAELASEDVIAVA